MSVLPDSYDEWTLDGVLAYIEGRLRSIYDAPNARRPRWTVQDAQAFGFLRGAYLEARESRSRVAEHEGTTHQGHAMYDGTWLSYHDFELILLALGASGSDVQRLWPPASESRAREPEAMPPDRETVS